MRILISFLLLMISFVYSAEECRIEKVPDTSFVPPPWSDGHSFCSHNTGTWENCVRNPTVKNNGDGTYTRCVDHAYGNGQPNTNIGTRCEWGSSPYPVIEKEICDETPKPPQSAQDLLDAWNKCKSGKASPLFVGSPDQLKWLNGRPVKKLMCDHPPIDAVIYFDSWDDYAKDRNPKIPDFNDKSPDEPEKPTDPVDPTDPKDPKPGEGGDGENPGTGGDNGSGNGNDNGGCIGNNCGNGNDNENGKGLTKSDVTQAIKDADILGCNGNNCKAGDFSALGGDAGFADIPKSFWESKYESHDLMKLYEEKIESTGNSIVSQIRNINTDLGEGTCPVIELPEEFGSFQFDCDFLQLIKAAFLFSATLTAFFIVFRR